MNRLTLTTAAVCVSMALVVSSDSPSIIEYRVENVTRHLLLQTSDGEQPLAAGGLVHSGDSLRTGPRSKAELSALDFAARFVIDAKTRVRLAHDNPGILLELERGSLRAVFDKLTGNAERERLVTTPSAVLAVRGTEYGVEVEKDGDTSVVVFDGTVEVWERSGRGKRVRVAAGQATRVRRGHEPSAPKAHGLKRSDWDRGRHSVSRMMGQGQQAPGGEGAGGAGGGGPNAPSGSGSRRHGG
jgi:hypothetical protein